MSENVKHMHICCDGSFGNRYSGLIGGLTLARLCGLPATISWPSTNMCRALWDDIFAPRENVVDWRLKEFFPHVEKYDFLTVSDQHVGLFRDHGKMRMVDPGALTLEQACISVANSQKNIFYYTPLIYDWLPENEVQNTIRELFFNREIMAVVANYLSKNLQGGYYGIHLRMTDFKGIEDFDVDFWYNTVEKDIQNKFFICSDDPATEARFSGLPNAFSYPKEYKTEKFIAEGDWHHPYTDEDGRSSVFNVERGTDHVREAVIDFLLLSLSQPFDTGVQSTFLRMAKRVGSAFKS